ncbi:probable endochitinase [Anoplophora glabripennis]|uniref:probable endochitinase n=1 Tax=Anoplophora glabripennis TaxID=217634 RepID=UPI000C7637AC|nr:probable endochitinase [Anoplophora glabripennis]
MIISVSASTTTTPVTIETTTGPYVTTNEPPSPGTTTSPGSTTTPANLCANMPDGTFLSDPSDCSKFYECLYGKEISGTCPLDLLWNEQKLTCDYPENVVCNK